MSKLAHRVAMVALLLAFFAQGMVHIRHASITFDEGPHLATGYTTLKTGDLRLLPVHIHPPLANVLSAAPLLLQDDLPDPRAIDGWEIASLSAVTDAVVWRYPHPKRLAIAGRLPILWLGVLLGALLARWASDLGPAGKRGGLPLLALALYAFDPNMIAHGSLITTDMAATCLAVATLYGLERALGRSGKQRAVGSLIGVGILLGLAQLAKVSSALLAPVIAIRLLFDGPIAKPAEMRQSIPRFVRRSLAVFVSAAFAVWAGYGFEVGLVPGLPFPIPAVTHLRIFQSLQEHYTLGHPTFLMGRVSSHGWRTYFPLVFLLKTPLPLLLLCGWALLCSLRRSGPSQRRRADMGMLFRSIAGDSLSLFPILYALTSLFSTVNIGYRHLLPLLPFIYLGIARSFEWAGQLRRQRIIQRAIVPLVLVWLILGTVKVRPDYLAFFNGLAGGPAGGYRYLVDSNLDWGQNLHELSTWMADRGEDHIYYAHYSPARPGVYGIPADFLPPDPRAVSFTPWRPAPGLYAIGATVLQGPYAPDINTYAWFLGREPLARLGYALFLYRVEASPVPAWAVLCSGTGLLAENVRANLGQAELRVIEPDCAQTYVYPGGMAAGLYIVSPSTAAPHGRYAFALRRPTGDDAAHLYSVEEGPPQPAQRIDGVIFDGPLELLGYSLQSQSENASHTLTVWWRVISLPTRPLSLMAHLISAEGDVIDVGDGLGFPLDQWRLGDIIVQQHRLRGSSEAGGLVGALHIGGYWLDTMERWQLAPSDRRESGDHWVLSIGE